MNASLAAAFRLKRKGGGILGKPTWIRTAVALFLFAIAVLTLFSNTMQTAMLPKVATEKPWTKQLAHPIKGSGVLVPRRQTELSSDTGWKIGKVHVKEKERVKKGQVLVTFDSSDGESQLQDAEISVRRLRLDIELLQDQYIAAQHDGDAEAIRKANRDLQSGRLELEAAQRNADKLRRGIAEKRALTAPYDGQVRELEAEEGMSVPAGQKLLTLVKSEEGFEFSFELPQGSAERLDLNEEIPVAEQGRSSGKLIGKVAEIRAASGGGSGPDQNSGSGGMELDAQRWTVTVAVSAPDLEGGEKVSVDIEKPAPEQGLVIDKKWLRQDAEGTYVFVIREERSALGNTYTAQKAYVVTGEEAKDEIVILRGLSPEDEIIAESSDPLQQGDRVAWSG
ncbi:efflux RND transporter periplasmic adaptor subunit [Paenibacillus macerans]|uniref:efflux RND transporter periplasmic adaptor subunit n=1 Tax=Paenibacillus macerans TaxID=44252 RepID=UPI003D3210DE